MVGWRSDAGSPAGRRNRSALSWLFIHTCTVWRKLPTMMPTEVVMAMAVDSAPTRTEVRRSDDARLRDASMASTPATRRSMPDETAVSPLTSAGMAKADAAMNSRAAAISEERLAGDGGRERGGCSQARRARAQSRDREFCELARRIRARRAPSPRRARPATLHAPAMPPMPAKLPMPMANPSSNDRPA